MNSEIYLFIFFPDEVLNAQIEADAPGMELINIPLAMPISAGVPEAWVALLNLKIIFLKLEIIQE